MREVLSDSGYRENARRIAARVAAADGLVGLAEIVDGLVSGPPRKAALPPR